TPDPGRHVLPVGGIGRPAVRLEEPARREDLRIEAVRPGAPGPDVRAVVDVALEEALHHEGTRGGVEQRTVRRQPHDGIAREETREVRVPAEDVGLVAPGRVLGERGPDAGDAGDSPRARENVLEDRAIAEPGGDLRREAGRAEARLDDRPDPDRAALGETDAAPVLDLVKIRHRAADWIRDPRGSDRM